MILRRALEDQEDFLQERIPCDAGIVVVFDDPARLLAERLIQRIHHLQRTSDQSLLDAEHHAFHEFQYEIRMCGMRLLQNTLVLTESKSV